MFNYLFNKLHNICISIWKKILTGVYTLKNGLKNSDFLVILHIFFWYPSSSSYMFGSDI